MLPFTAPDQSIPWVAKPTQALTYPSIDLTESYVATTHTQEARLICDELSQILDLTYGPWVAGGAARRLMDPTAPIGGDIDIFCRTTEQANRACEFVRKRYRHQEGFSKRKTKTSETFHMDTGERWTIQVIIGHIFPTVAHLLDDFDFTACQFATDGRRVLHTAQGLQDARDRKLIVHHANNRTGNLKRLIRYLTIHGFMIYPEELKKLLEWDGSIISDKYLNVTIKIDHDY